MLFTHQGRRRLHQRRDPLRRDDPPVGRRRHAAREAARATRGSSPASRSTRARSRSRSPRARPSPRASTVCASASPSTASSARASRSGARRTTITDELPSAYCIDVNAHALARYAALCQEAGIVPIVEPEVLMDGDHTIERSSTSTAAALRGRVRQLLHEQRCALEGMLLKPNMVLPGYDCAEAGVRRGDRRGDGARASGDVVPAAVPGHRVPVRRPDRRGGDGAPRRDEQARPAPVAAVVLVRPRAAGAGAEGVEGRRRERRRRAGRVPPPGADEQLARPGSTRADLEKAAS